VLAGLLGACSKTVSPPAAEAGFCTPMMTAQQVDAVTRAGEDPAHTYDEPGLPTSSTAQYETLAMDCLNRFARQYALSTDAADVTARAVVSACRVNIGFETSEASYAWRKANVDFPTIDQRQKAEEERFNDEALRLVVEARAGHCAPPSEPARPMRPAWR
ncbi:MAG: hypothetical protein ACRD3Q_11565, partial [Terriglobales bacterium]